MTQRDEADRVEILSGVVDGVTLGTPIALLVRNADARSGAYDHLADVYRPSHADFTTEAKYGIRAVAGGGRASARETIGRVAAGAVARKLLAERFGVEVLGWVQQVHHVGGPGRPRRGDRWTRSRPTPPGARTRTPPRPMTRGHRGRRGATATRWAASSTCVARGVPAGWGEPVFDKLEADLAKAVMSLPASKGFEIGSGFGAVRA